MTILTREQAVEAAKRRLAAIEPELQAATEFLRFLRSEDWPLMQKWLDHEIDDKMEKLLRMDLPLGDTTALRAEVWTLRRVGSLRNDHMRKVVKLGEEAKHLRNKLQEWHTRGSTEAMTTTLQDATRIEKAANEAIR